MRLIDLKGIGLLLLLFVISCSNIIRSDYMNWQRIFDENYYDEAYTVVTCRDGGLLLAGVTMPSPDNEELYIVKTDPIGNEEWVYIDGGFLNESAVDAIQLEDGSFLVAGYTESIGAGEADCWVIKLDERGERLWSRVYGGRFDDKADVILPAENSGFYLFGRSLSYSSSAGYQCWALRLDRAGLRKWEKLYATNDSSIIFDACHSADGNILLAGKSLHLDEGTDIWVIKINTNGNKIWSKLYGVEDRETANSILALEDGSSLVAGYSEAYDGLQAEAYLMKLSADGEKLWEQHYGESYWDSAKSIVAGNQDDFVITGVREKRKWFLGGLQDDLLILRVDSNGNLLQELELGGKGHDNGNSIGKLSGGGFAIAGRVSAGGKSDSGCNAWVLHYQNLEE